jgi:hypothetical protein
MTAGRIVPLTSLPPDHAVSVWLITIRQNPNSCRPHAETLTKLNIRLEGHSGPSGWIDASVSPPAGAPFEEDWLKRRFRLTR